MECVSSLSANKDLLMALDDNQASNVKSLIKMDKFAAIRKVLAQPLLLEAILGFVIWNSNDTKDQENLTAIHLKTLRLVCSDWRDAISKLLRDRVKPLYHLKLSEKNSIRNLLPTRNEEKLLDKFVKFYTSTHAKTEPAPTFSLTLELSYFRQENYQSLYSCLRQCGKGLLKLSMEFPADAKSFSGRFSRVTLPALRKMRLHFRFGACQTNDKAFALAQLLLDKSANLNDLVLLSISPFRPGLEKLRLPKSIDKLEMVVAQINFDWLLSNHLPNLTTLYLSSYIPNRTALSLSDLLEQYKSTLSTIGFTCFNNSLASGVVFPEMPNLQVMKVYTTSAFAFEVKAANFSTCFPKLRRLNLERQTLAMWHKWTAGPPMPSLTELLVEITDTSKLDEPGNWLPISLETMTRVCFTFSNVRVLTLHIAGSETCAVKHLFANMKQLTNLAFMLSKADAIVNEDLWDSLLIGVSFEEVANLRAEPEAWNNGRIENEDIPSIRMLSGLKVLELTATYDENKETPLISDLSFSFSFLKMPNLTELVLLGRFGASEESKTKWISRGGKIVIKTDPGESEQFSVFP